MADDDKPKIDPTKRDPQRQFAFMDIPLDAGAFQRRLANFPLPSRQDSILQAWALSGESCSSLDLVGLPCMARIVDTNIKPVSKRPRTDDFPDFI